MLHAYRALFTVKTTNATPESPICASVTIFAEDFAVVLGSYQSNAVASNWL